MEISVSTSGRFFLPKKHGQLRSDPHRRARTALTHEAAPYLPAAFLLLPPASHQAGHGFFNSSPHAKGLGAFVNLEVRYGSTDADVAY